MRLLLLALLALPVGTSAQTIHPSLSGGALLNALVEDYKPSSVLSLSASKDALYSVVDSVHVDGVVGSEGLYTGRFVPFDCDPTCDPSQDVHNGGAGLNQEHVWPRSQGAHCTSGSPAGCDPRAESDLHHLRAAVGAVNSARGNLPFGESPDEETSAWYGAAGTTSTAPAEAIDLYSERLGATWFEPREREKGDVARAALYVYTMYGPRASRQANPTFFALMRATLLDWHDADPPDARETARMWRAAGYQQDLPNPYILDATLAHRAFGAGDPDEGATLASAARAAYVPTAWINELHYDNEGADAGEFVEVAVDAAFSDLAALRLTLYNGADGSAYGQESLDEFEAGERVGSVQFYHIAFPSGGLQNGDPDGLALSFHDEVLGDSLLTFLCYEGTLTAVGGAADGQACLPLGASESNATPLGASVQLEGTGSHEGDFAWQSRSVATPGTPNLSQTLAAPLRVVTVDGADGWRMMAAPAAMPIGDMLAGVWTQGATGSDAPQNAPSVYRWRAPTDGAAHDWEPVVDFSETLEAGAGLAVYLYADDDPTVPGEQGGFPKTFPSVGYPAGQPFAFKLAGSSGGDDTYRMLGNPTGVPLVWREDWPRGDVGASVSVYDASMPGYRVHNGTAGTLASGEIPAYSAFWVEVTGPAPHLIAPPPTASPARRMPIPMLRLRAVAAGLTAELAVADDARAQRGRDGLDVAWRPPFAAQSLALATRVDASYLALDARPLSPGDTLTVELRTLGVTDTLDVELRWPDLPDVALSLHDPVSGEAQAMAPGGSATFRVEPDAAHALTVVVGAPAVALDAPPAEELTVMLSPNPARGGAQLAARATGARLSATVYDALGRRVATLDEVPNELAATLDLGRFGSGVYAVRVTATREGGEAVSMTRRLTVVR